MLSAYHGHAPLVQLLLDHGADPNRVNDRGQSPLAGAVFKGEDAVVEVFLLSPPLSYPIPLLPSLFILFYFYLFSLFIFPFPFIFRGEIRC